MIPTLPMFLNRQDLYIHSQLLLYINKLVKGVRCKGPHKWGLLLVSFKVGFQELGA